MDCHNKSINQCYLVNLKNISTNNNYSKINKEKPHNQTLMSNKVY